MQSEIQTAGLKITFVRSWRPSASNTCASAVKQRKRDVKLDAHNKSASSVKSHPKGAPAYNLVRELATEQGLSVEDLLALSAGNDPFNVGAPLDWQRARWFAELWPGPGTHLRRLHYRLAVQANIENRRQCLHQHE